MEFVWPDVQFELIMISQTRHVIVVNLNVQVVKMQLSVVSVIQIHSMIRQQRPVFSNVLQIHSFHKPILLLLIKNVSLVQVLVEAVYSMEDLQLLVQHVKLLVNTSLQQVQSLNITKDFLLEQSLLKVFTEVLVAHAPQDMDKLEVIVSLVDWTVHHVTRVFVLNVLLIWSQELMDGVLLIVLWLMDVLNVRCRKLMLFVLKQSLAMYSSIKLTPNSNVLMENPT